MIERDHLNAVEVLTAAIGDLFELLFDRGLCAAQMRECRMLGTSQCRCCRAEGQAVVHIHNQRHSLINGQGVDHLHQTTFQFAVPRVFDRQHKIVVFIAKAGAPCVDVGVCVVTVADCTQAFTRDDLQKSGSDMLSRWLRGKDVLRLPECVQSDVLRVTRILYGA